MDWVGRLTFALRGRVGVAASTTMGEGGRLQPRTAPETRRLGSKGLAPLSPFVYGECMASKTSTTVRLDPEDVEALERARADGLSASDLIRKGLRTVAARYYKNRRPPSTGLFVSTDLKLGEESELFADLKK